MDQCDHCNGAIRLSFDCQYCGGSFCGEHRQPEHHDCPDANQARTVNGPDLNQYLEDPDNDRDDHGETTPDREDQRQTPAEARRPGLSLRQVILVLLAILGVLLIVGLTTGVVPVPAG